MSSDKAELFKSSTLELILPSHLTWLAESADIRLYISIYDDVYFLKVSPFIFRQCKSLYIPCKFKHGFFKLENYYQ